jgi:hypothetical protein
MSSEARFGLLRLTMSHRRRRSATLDYTAAEANAALGLPPLGAASWEHRLTSAQRLLSVSVQADYTIGRTQLRAQYAFDRRNVRFVTEGSRLSLFAMRRF